MNKEIIINSTPQVSRVAIMEDSHLVEIFIEEKQNSSIVGNIYKGRVIKVLPGMQSAFINIGLDKDAFLYVDDVFEGLDDIEELMFNEEEQLSLKEGKQAAKPQHLAIDELLRKGQEILCQVVKEPIGRKGARISAYITLPGRYLVYMPNVANSGISRKIKSDKERLRLRKILNKLCKHSVGLIVRTAGEKKQEKHFKADLEYLSNLWEEIKTKADKAKAPSLIHREMNLLRRILRDLFSSDFSTIRLDNEEDYEKCLEFLNRYQPNLVSRVKLYTKGFPIFEYYGIEAELEAALKNKIWLKSGGYIVINQTEALVAIDVNTGKYVGKRTLEDTVFKINLEAAKEIARQIRLRDLGGIIVIDFIDMGESVHRTKLLECLEQYLERDRSQSKILNFNEFGLVEITRKRVRQSLEEILTQYCPYCSGLGRIKSISTICYEIQRELLKQYINLSGRDLIIRVNPEVGEALKKEKRTIIEDLESQLKSHISIKSDYSLHHEQFDIMPL
jgi:ribonuclease G